MNNNANFETLDLFFPDPIGIHAKDEIWYAPLDIPNPALC